MLTIDDIDAIHAASSCWCLVMLSHILGRRHEEHYSLWYGGASSDLNLTCVLTIYDIFCQLYLAPLLNMFGASCAGPSSRSAKCEPGRGTIPCTTGIPLRGWQNTRHTANQRSQTQSPKHKIRNPRPTSSTHVRNTQNNTCSTPIANFRL